MINPTTIEYQIVTFFKSNDNLVFRFVMQGG